TLGFAPADVEGARIRDDVTAAEEVLVEEKAGELFGSVAAERRGVGPAGARLGGHALVERTRNAAPAEQQEVGAQRLEVVENVRRNEDIGAVAGEIAEDIGHVLAPHGIEAVHRLVEDDEGGLVEEALREF